MNILGAWRYVVPATKNDIERILMKVSELADRLTAVDDQLDKAKTEILGQLQALKDALANQDVPPNAQAAIDRLTAAAQALDDITPDAPAAPAAPAAPTP